MIEKIKNSENIDLAYSKKLIDEIDSLYPYHIQVPEDDE